MSKGAAMPFSVAAENPAATTSNEASRLPQADTPNITDAATQSM
jgi:hypothetical protein